MSSKLPSFLNLTEQELNVIQLNLRNRELFRSSLSFNHQESIHHYSILDGLNNNQENRYNDIIAYDRTRLLFPSTSTSSYINASLIQEPSILLNSSTSSTSTVTSTGGKNWIAAQAPLPNTLHSFLSVLLLPSHSQVHPEELETPNLIIQLTKLTELGRQKCSAYFALIVGQKIVYHPSPTISFNGRTEKSIYVILKSKTQLTGYRRNDLVIGFVSETGEEEKGKEVVQVEWRNWPDHGVPINPNDLLSFISSMSKLATTLSLATSSSSPTPSNNRPVLIHCSAGVGRTGTFITIASIMHYLDTLHSSLTKNSSSTSIITSPTSNSNSSSPLPPYPLSLPVSSSSTPSSTETKNTKDLDLIGYTIDSLREQRTTMVQNSMQVGFCWEALRSYWEGLNKS